MVAGMAGTTVRRARRRRGSLGPSADLFATVREPTKKRLDELADAAGVSLAVVLEELVAHTDLDSRGLPAWWSLPIEQQEELDISA